MLVRGSVLQVPRILPILGRKGVYLLLLPRPHMGHALQQDVLSQYGLLPASSASLQSIETGQIFEGIVQLQNKQIGTLALKTGPQL